MKRICIGLAAIAMAAAVAMAGCAQAGPAPTPTKAPPPPTRAAEPTKAPAAPTKAVEPTKAPAVQPTAAPAKKVDFPAQGRSITYIVPWPAGGSGDIHSRILAAALEADLGVPVQVVNRGGASSQIGLTELVRSKPDGYTFAWFTTPTGIATYLDPDKKAVYSRKDFQPVSLLGINFEAVAVRADSPFKSAKDMMDAAKANPGKVSSGTTGLLADAHLALLLLQRKANVKLNIVQFEGGGPQMTALMGGHIDSGTGGDANYVAPVKSGQMRLLGIMSREENPLFPGVKTFRSQGYDIEFGAARAIVLPTGTPKEIVDVLDGAIKRVLGKPEVKQKFDEAGLPLSYMDSAKFASYWTEQEAETKSLLEEAWKEQK